MSPLYARIPPTGNPVMCGHLGTCRGVLGVAVLTLDIDAHGFDTTRDPAPDADPPIEFVLARPGWFAQVTTRVCPRCGMWNLIDAERLRADFARRDRSWPPTYLRRRSRYHRELRRGQPPRRPANS